jgi:hypothetical protein
MTRFSNEELSTFLDGAASPDLVAAIEAELAVSEALAEQLAQMRDNDEFLRAAIDARLAAKPFVMPEIAPVAKVIALPRRNAQRRVWAMAASLLLAVVAGWAAGTWSNTPSVIALNNGKVFAAAQLSQALSLTQSGVATQTRSGAFTVALSFRDRAGSYCRQFSIQSGENATAGVACFDNGAWRIVGTAAVAPQNNGIQAAAGDTPPAISALIDGIGVAQALDRAAENKAISTAWSK